MNVCSSKLNSKVVYVSDEFFASALNLLNPDGPISKPNMFTDHGAWMDGWESKRHNPNYDVCIIKLGYASTINKIVIDTSYFTGNYAPFASIEGFLAGDDLLNEFEVNAKSQMEDVEWKVILNKSKLEGNKKNFFDSEDISDGFNLIRFKIYPDGGIARLRLYGDVVKIDLEKGKLYDLAYVGHGGKVIKCSDQHYGNKDNLILPGRGENMGDGWETKRSREPNHTDYAIIKLSCMANLEFFEVDTNFFKGNYPKLVNIYAAKAYNNGENEQDIEWIQITDPLRTEAHKIHKLFVKDKLKKEKFEYVKLEIVPDGGIQRLRAYGYIFVAD